MKKIFYTLLFVCLLFMAMVESSERSAAHMKPTLVKKTTLPQNQVVFKKDGWVRWGGVEQQLYKRKGQTVTVLIDKDGIVFLTAQEEERKTDY